MALNKQIIIAPIFLAISACGSMPPDQNSLWYSPSPAWTSPYAILQNTVKKTANVIRYNGMVRGVDCENVNRNTIDIGRKMPCELAI